MAFDPATPPAKAELCFTADSGAWPGRKWQIQPAGIDQKTRKATAEIPEGTTAYYFALSDKQNLLVSSEHVETARP